ncbi:MAG: hypothetical protein IKN72_11595 [Clostridia bacterium]|nr:hypothetical protein [Clostridia bacterium]
MKRTLALLLTLVLILTTFAGCMKKKSGGKAEDTSEYEALYAPVLKKYKQAFDENWPREKFIENNLSPNLATLEKTAEPSFAFLDLNGDKTPELFIGRKGNDGVADDLYTITKDGDIQQIGMSDENKTVTVGTDDRIYTDETDGTGKTVTTVGLFEDSKVEPTDTYLRDPGETTDGEHEWFRKNDSDEYEPITEEEYIEGTKRTPKPVEPKPFDELDEGTLKDVPSAEIIPMETTKFLTATAEDFDKLGTDFYNYTSILNGLELEETFFKFINNDYDTQTAQFIASFDSTKMDTKAFRDYLFFISSSSLYDRYFDEPESIQYDETNDPFPETESENPFHIYTIYPEKNIRWIAENVLNMEQPFDREAFCKSSDNDSYLCKYKDGAFYFWLDGYDSELVSFARIKKSEIMGDHRYKIIVEYFYDEYEMRCNVVGEGTLIAGLKDIDGQRIWSIYNYDADITVEWDHEIDPPPRTFQYPETEQPDQQTTSDFAIMDAEDETNSNSNTTQTIVETYEDIFAPILQQYKNNLRDENGYGDEDDYSDCIYAYHDIDEDGIPELLIETEKSGLVSRKIDFYTCRQDGTTIYLGECGRADTLFDGDHELIRFYAHTSLEYFERITIKNGKIQIDEDINPEETSGMLKGNHIEFNSISEWSP